MKTIVRILSNLWDDLSGKSAVEAACHTGVHGELEPVHSTVYGQYFFRCRKCGSIIVT